MPHIDVRVQRSRQQVRAALAERGVASRTELSAMTGLALSTVASTVRGLVEEGAVCELRGEAASTGRRGRPATLLRLSNLSGHVIGLELGHTEIIAGIATPSETVLAERRVRHEPGENAQELANRAGAVIEELLECSGLELSDVNSTVVCVPAPIDPRTGHVHDASIIVDAWRGTYPANILESRLGCPVTVVNDANAAAVAEHMWGAGRHIDDLIYLQVTLGVGAGLILAGSLYTGDDGGAGEIGHIRLHGTSELCKCGQRGCLESEASVLSVTRKLAAVGVTIGPDQTFEKVLSEQAANPVVMRLLTEAGRALGSVLADLCNVLSPAMVIVGGELATGGVPLREGIEESLRRYALSTVSRRVQIEFSQLGARAGMIGAMSIGAARVRALNDGLAPGSAVTLTV